jgi:hypothetical protein
MPYRNRQVVLATGSFSPPPYLALIRAGASGGERGFASLADRIDLVAVAASPLPPRVTVVPDVATLDLKTDNAGAIDRDDEVHLMVFEVVGDTLAGNHQAVWLKLFRQGLLDIALGRVGKAGRFLGSIHHGSSRATTPHSCSTSAVEGCIS